METEKLVMFDFDGVIADSWCGQKRAFADALLAHGLDEFATSATFRDLLEANWFEALAESGVPAHVVADIEEAFGSVPSPDLFPGMAEVIERLSQAHTVVVITSSATEDVRRILHERRVRGVQRRSSAATWSRARRGRSARRAAGTASPWSPGTSATRWVTSRRPGRRAPRSSARAGAGTAKSVCFAPTPT